MRIIAASHVAAESVKKIGRSIYTATFAIRDTAKIIFGNNMSCLLTGVALLVLIR